MRRGRHQGCETPHIIAVALPIRSYYDEITKPPPGAGDKWFVSHAILNLGHIERVEGYYEAAYARYQESLALFRDSRSAADLLQALEGIASLQDAVGKSEPAARWFEAVEALRETLCLTVSVPSRAQYMPYVESARIMRAWRGLIDADLGAASSNSAWRARL